MYLPRRKNSTNESLMNRGGSSMNRGASGGPDLAEFGGGFNRSMQHNNAMKRRECCDETETPNLLQ